VGSCYLATVRGQWPGQASRPFTVDAGAPQSGLSRLFGGSGGWCLGRWSSGRIARTEEHGGGIVTRYGGFRGSTSRFSKTHLLSLIAIGVAGNSTTSICGIRSDSVLTMIRCHRTTLAVAGDGDRQVKPPDRMFGSMAGQATVKLDEHLVPLGFC